MPLDSGEVLSRSTQQIRKATQDIRAAVRELGTSHDAVARDRVRRSRMLAQQFIGRAEPILAVAATPQMEPLRMQYARARADYDAANTEALRRERQTFKHTDPVALADDVVEGDGTTAPLLAGQQQQVQVRVQDIRAVDLSEFHTEEAIQREKLHSAREIESDVMDLKTTYQEFHSLVNQQQDGLDIVSSNVTQSNNLAEGGHGQIQQASRHQKRCRKIGCGVGIVVVLVVIAVVIVLVVVASK